MRHNLNLPFAHLHPIVLLSRHVPFSQLQVLGLQNSEALWIVESKSKAVLELKRLCLPFVNSPIHPLYQCKRIILDTKSIKPDTNNNNSVVTSSKTNSNKQIVLVKTNAKL